MHWKRLLLPSQRNNEYHPNYGSKYLAKHTAFFFEYTSREELLLSLLPIARLTPEMMRQTVKKCEGLSLFTPKEQQLILANIDSRHDFITNLCFNHLKASPSLLVAKVSEGEQRGKTFGKLLVEFRKELTQSEINFNTLIQATSQVYQGQRKNSKLKTVNSHYCQLAQQKNLTAETLAHQVTLHSITLSHDSFICLAVHIANEVELLDQYFSYLSSETKSNVLEGKLLLRKAPDSQLFTYNPNSPRHARAKLLKEVQRYDAINHPAEEYYLSLTAMR